MNKNYYLEKFKQLHLVETKDVKKIISYGEVFPHRDDIVFKFDNEDIRIKPFILPSYRISMAVIRGKSVIIYIDIIKDIQNIFEFLRDIDEMIGIKSDSNRLIPSSGKLTFTQIMVTYEIKE
jgi:hypothetical protein